MRIRALLLAVLAAGTTAFAQKGPDAVIQDCSESFRMTSSTTGVYKVHREVQVLDQDGLDAGTFFIYTDSFRSLGEFSAELLPGDGGKKMKISKKDIDSYSISSGLADDTYACAFRPDMRYPFTVVYDYTVNYKNGIILFPVFYPLETDNTELKKAEYTLEVPAGTEIEKSFSCLEFSHTPGGKTDVYRWTCSDVPAFILEHNIPPFDGRLPELYAAPVDFSYAGTTGSQASWNSYGLWLNSLMEGASDLPESEKETARRLTSSCKTTFEKVQALYSYLRQKSRYISIQLGIGGLKPLPASHVAKTGFGDCKALSNYMKAMLREAGVESDYYAISTRNANLKADFVSVGQMNHVMLAVPLPENRDTLFVECTNPSYPLGYRHFSCAGHQILLVREDGGHLVRVGDYADSLRRDVQKTEVVLSADGSAKLSIREQHYLDECEPFIDFASMNPQDQTRMLIRGWQIKPENFKLISVSDNFGDYAVKGRDFCAEKDIDYSMDCKIYASRNGNRLFVPVNPVAKSMETQRSARQNGLFFKHAYALIDELTVHCPAGYRVESKPDDVSLDAPWGTYTSTISCEGDTVTIRQEFRSKRFLGTKDCYPQYKDFARKLNKSYSSSIVLIAE